MLWCELTDVLQRHIVFSIIYCAALVSVEVCGGCSMSMLFVGFNSQEFVSFSRDILCSTQGIFWKYQD